MFDLGDKTAAKSLTILGAALFAGLQAAEGLGTIPAGMAAQAAVVGKAVAFMIGTFGLRRAVGSPIVVEDEHPVDGTE
jgi:hypothetical protein